MPKAYLALGSNLGDRADHLRGAVQGLDRTSGVRVVAVSRVYETDPVGGPGGQGAYLNAVVEVETDRDARALLEVGQALEIAAGREPDVSSRIRWGPRELDVDVLIVDDEEVNEPDLVVPHPRMGDRPFVLAPLEDVAPDLPVVVRGRESFAGWPGVRVVDVELKD